jgi:hypothetical protein
MQAKICELFTANGMMMARDFTEQERRLVALFVHYRHGVRERVLVYVAYVLPSILVASYGFSNADFAASLLAYLALLFPATVYLGRYRRNLDLLRSIIEKYEAKLDASGARPS